MSKQENKGYEELEDIFNISEGTENNTSTVFPIDIRDTSYAKLVEEIFIETKGTYELKKQFYGLVCILMTMVIVFSFMVIFYVVSKDEININTLYI